MKFGTGVDVLEVVTWAEFKFNGCKFYSVSNFGLLHWLCLWALTQCSATALPVRLWFTVYCCYCVCATDTRSVSDS